MPLNESLLDDKLAALEKARVWSSRVISKLENFIRTADDYALFRVNPLAYATEKNMDEREAVDLFLHAAKLGLFEIEWHLVCQTCGSVAHSFQELARVHSNYMCVVCGTEGQANLDDFIQVAFTLAPLIRDNIYRHPEQLSIEVLFRHYYLSNNLLPFPNGMQLADIIFSISPIRGWLEPGETRTTTFDVPPNTLLHGSSPLESGANFGVVVVPDAHSEAQRLALTFADGKYQANIPTGTQRLHNPVNPAITTFYDQLGQMPAGPVTLEIHNAATRRMAMMMLAFPLESPPPIAPVRPFLSGKQLLTTQTFRDLFRSEVTQSEESLGVRDITLLFTDLKGSTALYEQIGDPKAFFLVRQHFDTLGRVVVKYNGAIVKTIGDAVMATFMTPLSATQAALEMLNELAAFNRNISEALILKIGVHRGHSIAVALNDRVDYFGQTVNIAARIQALADANEICLSDDVYAHPGVKELLTHHSVAHEMANVKGVSGALGVYRIKHEI